MAKTYTKTRVEAIEAMLLISKADGILANDRACRWDGINSHSSYHANDRTKGIRALTPDAGGIAQSGTVCYCVRHGRSSSPLPYPFLLPPIGDKAHFGDKRCEKARYFEGFW